MGKKKFDKKAARRNAESILREIDPIELDQSIEAIDLHEKYGLEILERLQSRGWDTLGDIAACGDDQVFMVLLYAVRNWSEYPWTKRRVHRNPKETDGQMELYKIAFCAVLVEMSNILKGRKHREDVVASRRKGLAELVRGETDHFDVVNNCYFELHDRTVAALGPIANLRDLLGLTEEALHRHGVSRKGIWDISESLKYFDLRLGMSAADIRQWLDQN